MKKRVCLLLITFLFFLTRISSVEAVEYMSGNTYYFSSENGTYHATYFNGGHADKIKKIDNNYAYCVQWKKPIRSSAGYKLDTTWSIGTKKAIIAGILMELVDEKYDGDQRYGMTAAALNTYFNRYLKSENSYNFYTTNSVIKGFYDEAFKIYKDEYKVTKKLPTLSLEAYNNDVIFNYNSSGKYYVSNKITLSGMQDKYGGDEVTYTISVSNGAKICSKSSGVESSCVDSSVAFTNRSKEYSFYIKATDVTANDDVKITVSGKNSSVYPSSIRYENGDENQLLLAKTTYSINRSTSKSLVLTVPDLTKHRIVAYKLDDNGDLLSGAELSIYRDDYTKESNLLAKNTGNSSKITYTSPNVSVDDDDFFNHDYYLVEFGAPDGYVLNSTVNHFYIKGSSIAASSTVCYDNGGSDSDESKLADSPERCNFDAYQYKCKSTDGTVVDVPESGNCEELNSNNAPSGETGDGSVVEDGNENVSTVEDDTTDPGATGDSDNNEETGDDESLGGDTVPTTPVEYTQICYNTDKSQEVEDTTYCSNKDNYIKVTRSSGNLTVRQVNKKNSVKISKRSATGEDELAGASLKICTADSYKLKKNECDPAKTIDDVEMSWTSGSTPYEFSGIKVGKYYIVEILAPVGYLAPQTATEFSIDEAGTVKSGEKIVNGNEIIIENKITSLSVSKQDIATSKELPGATISICTTYVDSNGKIQMNKNQYTGNCVSAILANGDVATWVSTDKPKKITGLSVGTYYLVERIAPKNYGLAESILFKVTEDGKLVDENGVSLADNKLVMKDKKIENPKTGIFPIIIVGLFAIGACCFGIGSYYSLGKKDSNIVQKIDKIRKRKIHK